MKKFLKLESLLCVAFMPVLYFLFSKMTTFFMDAFEIEISSIFRTGGIIVAEALIIIFRRKITEYLTKDIGSGVATVITIISFLCVFLNKPVYLRGCMDEDSFICAVGSGVLYSIFLCLLFKSISYLAGRIRKIKITKKDLIFMFGIFLVLNLGAIIFCRFMKVIYVWDDAGYFTTVHKLNDIFPSAEYFKSVYNSIFETDYNYVIMLPASLMCKLFGKSRLVFVLSIINFYLYPLFVLIYFCGKRYFKLGVTKVVCVLLCLPYMIFAANTGFIDIGGIIPVFLAIVLYFYGNRDKNSVLIGVLLAISIYMRRWYSFFALSFVITILIHAITKKQYKSFFEVLGAMAFILLFFTQDFVSKKLMADYSDMYSAYALGIRADIMIFTRYFGVLLTLVLSLYVVIKQILCRKSICNETFILIQAILMFSMFTSVQTHGQQHLSLYVPAFLVMVMSLFAKIKGRVGIAVMLAVSSLQTVNTFIPRVQPTSIQAIKNPAIIPDFSNYPRVEENAESILAVTEYMDREIGEKGKTVCFLASSRKLNYDTLKNAEVSLSVERKSNANRDEYYYTVSGVDNRDKLSRSLFVADYVLVPSELQIHLAEEEQEVIAIPYRMITERIGFGAAYEKEDTEFILSDGTEIYLYRRTRNIEDKEFEEVYNMIFE